MKKLLLLIPTAIVGAVGFILFSLHKALKGFDHDWLHDDWDGWDAYFPGRKKDSLDTDLITYQD